MWACVYTFVSLFLRVCGCVCGCICMCVCMSLCMCLCLVVCLRVHVCISHGRCVESPSTSKDKDSKYITAYMPVWRAGYIYVYIYTHMYIYIYIYIYICTAQAAAHCALSLIYDMLMHRQEQSRNTAVRFRHSAHFLIHRNGRTTTSIKMTASCFARD